MYIGVYISDGFSIGFPGFFPWQMKVSESKNPSHHPGVDMTIASNILVVGQVNNPFFSCETTCPC